METSLSGTVAEALMAEVVRARAAGEDIGTPAARALFGRFVQDHHGSLVRYCRSQKVDDPEDLAQVVWAIAWRRLHTFKQQSSLWTWVRGIAWNRCSHARAKMRDVLTEDGLLDPDSREVDVVRQLQHAERESLMLAAIKVLPEGEQDVVWMKWHDGYSHARIAELMDGAHGVSEVKDVKAILQKSKRHLKDELKRRLAILDESTGWIRSFTR